MFDQDAVRSIGDGNTGVDATGHFQPVGNDLQALEALDGLAATTKGALPGLNGTWNFLASYNTVTDTSTTLRYVNGVTLNFSSGNDPGSVGAENTVADKNTLYLIPNPDINPTDPTAANAYPTVTHTDNLQSPYYDGIAGTNVTGNGTITAPTQGTIPLLPAPVIASDNTLGSFSQYEGRIYVAFTGMFRAPRTSPRTPTPTSSCSTPTTAARPGPVPSRSTTTTRKPTATAPRTPRASTLAAPAPSSAGPSTSPRSRSTSPPAMSSSRSSTPATTRPTPGWPPTSP